jgi:hypothetical protein
MQTNNPTAEIAALEDQLKHYQELLDKAFSENVEFSEVKVIYHETKKIADKLEAVKNKASG